MLTGHLGAWELSSFYHSLMGHPMGMVIRRLDNRRLDEFVNGIRCLHGNRVLHKDDFARGLLTAMHAGGAVGILMDTNMTPPQGEFVKFFGIDACTASGLARVALKTGAAVLPGFMLWEPAGKKVRSPLRPATAFLPKPAIRRPTFLLLPRNATMCSSPGSAGIPTSGFGFIAAGRPALRGNLRSTSTARRQLNAIAQKNARFA